ncbi:enoyl-CoA hydratase-related protein [Paraburkholderia nodosa]|uniref:enoyl-CoA hydratase-related protein n=1 Tax=Paraburkholderia nodosa TaxID=392320 RepID=UPI0004B0228A|nr:enoyl-CoA hydratase-related protein [Paraburkholderia nodosa]
MNDQYFRLSTEAGIAHLQLNRPDRLNVMDLAFYAGLREIVQTLDTSGEVRVLVISSTGKHFSAGMDFEVFANISNDFDTSSPRKRLGFQRALAGLMDCFDVLDKARFPVICAVQGGCIGGGLDLAVACDIRVCTADAFFCLQETQIGMVADLGVLQRLPKLIPAGVARQMAYTSERLSAERALAVGLVNAVLPDADALQHHAMELARSIASKSPLAVAGSKTAMNFARDHGTAESLQHMALLQSAIFDTAELSEAIAGWQARRAPRFEALPPLQSQGERPASADLQTSAHTDGIREKTLMSYSIESTVGDLLESAAAKAIVEKHLPGISSHPQIGMARGMALTTAAKFTDGLISQDALEKIDADLKALD